MTGQGPEKNRAGETKEPERDFEGRRQAQVDALARPGGTGRGRVGAAEEGSAESPVARSYS